MPRLSRSSAFLAAGVVVLCIFAGAIATFATSQGIGLSADSVMYIGGARGLLAHRGYGFVADDGWFAPVVTYMPAFPAILAIVGARGVDLIVAARWIVVALFAINVALVASIIRYNTNRSTWAAFIGAAIFALSPAMLSVHTFAYSEPLFIALILAAIGFFSSAMKSPRPFAKIAACGAMLALAYLTRYAALSFIASMMLGAIFFLPGSWKRRAACAAIIAGISAVAIVPWMVRNHRLGISSVGRSAQWHPIQARNVHLGVATMAHWLLPASVSWPGLALILYGVALLAAVIVGLQREPESSAESSPPKRPALVPAMLLMSFIYIVFLTVAICFFDSQIPLDARLFSPLFVLLVIATTIAIANSPLPPLRRATVPLAIALLIVSACGAWMDAREWHADGLGYAAASWRDSPTIRGLRDLPPDTIVYSNGWDVIHLLTSRHTILLPSKPQPDNPDSRALFDTRMQELLADLKSRRAVIAYLRHSRHGGAFLDEEDLMQQLPLRRAARFEDGAIYVWQRRTSQGK